MSAMIESLSAWDLAIVAAAALWALALLASIVWFRFPKEGMRRTEKVLIALSLVLAALVGTRIARPADKPAKAAVVKSSPARGTCASITAGMSAKEVKEILGPPDRAVSAEDVLGPGAASWAFDASRCHVLLVDDTVERVE